MRASLLPPLACRLQSQQSTGGSPAPDAWAGRVVKDAGQGASVRVHKRKRLRGLQTGVAQNCKRARGNAAMPAQPGVLNPAQQFATFPVLSLPRLPSIHTCSRTALLLGSAATMASTRRSNGVSSWCRRCRSEAAPAGVSWETQVRGGVKAALPGKSGTGASKPMSTTVAPSAWSHHCTAQPHRCTAQNRAPRAAGPALGTG